MKRRPTVLCALFLALVTAGPAETLELPSRVGDAVGGGEFADLISSLEREDRERAIYNEIVGNGNVPNFLRQMVEIPITQGATSGLFHAIPDFLAVGSDDDYFLMPMTPILAQWIADETGTIMPTPRMSDAIHTAAAVKMNPQPIPPTAAMTTVPVFDDHNELVWTQRQNTLGAQPLGALVAGNKKDVVISRRLASNPSSVAIYGWHYQNGDNIQPLYTGHGITYADYSHGIRLIDDEMVVNGATLPITSVLANATFAPLISSEGTISQPRYNVGPPPELMPFEDDFPASGRELDSWIDRFTTPVLTSFAPVPPGGDGTVLRVADTRGGIDTTRIGFATDRDYFVEAHIYCDYRPDTNGFERIGIFVRDDGNGLFEGISSSGIRANSYALTFDSDTGRIQCLRTVNGSPMDMRSTPLLRPESAWRLFRIEARGDELTFFVDGEEILRTTDTAHPRGPGGIGYHDYFANNGDIRGTRAENFRAGRLDARSNQTAWRIGG